MAHTRRDFLKGTAGIAGAAAMTAACVPLAGASDINDPECAWAGEEPQIDEAQITETIECEALVIGEGTSGLFAGAFLADMGVKPLVIDKLPAPSGGIKGDLGAFNSRFNEEHDDMMDPASVFHQLVNYSAGRADTRLIKLWMEQSGACIEAVDDLLKKYNLGYVYHDGGYKQLNGVDVDPTISYPKNPTGHHIEITDEKILEEGGYSASSPAMKRIITENGGELREGLALVKLEHEGRKVTGIIAQDWDTEAYVRINAEKGVIVATGGYQGDTDLVAKLQPETFAYMSAKDVASGSTGDGQRACLWLGAAVDEVHTSMFFDRRAVMPGEYPPFNIESDYKSVNLGSHPFLKLNCYGDRFTNESQPYDYMLHTITNYPERVFVEIIDSDFAQNMLNFECVGCCRYHVYPSACDDYAAQKGEIIEALQERVGKQLEQLVEQGYAQKADTIEELAEKIGLPVDHVVAAVERNNELTAAGYDEDFYKEPYRLSYVQTPPFYAIRMCGRMLCTMDGVRTDTQMRVVDKQGEPFENLYCAGDCSGGLLTHTYPNLFTGLAAGRSMTWGWIAAKQIAQA